MEVKKADLIRQLTEKGYTKRDAAAIIEEFTAIILENLANGDAVSIRDFGCFDIQERKERACPNPITGERMSIPAHWVPRFYPGNGMRRVVKLWEDNEKRGLT